MQWFYRIWNRISNIGIHSNMPEEMEKHVMLTNQFAFTWIFIIFPYIILFAFYEKLGVYLLSILTIMHFVVLWLNYIRKYYISRMLEAIVPQLVIFLLAAMLFNKPHKDLVSSYYMLNLAFLAIPFMIYSLREKKYIIISIGFSISLYYLFDPLNSVLKLNYSTELYTFKIFEMYNYTVSWGMAVIGYTYVKRVSDVYQQKVILKEENFRRIFNASFDGIVITDLNGVLLEINEVELQRQNMSRDNISKKHTRELFFGNSEDLAKKQLRKIIKKGNSKFEYEKELKRNGTQYYDVSGKLFTYEGLPAIMFVVHDITERTHLQRKIVNTVYETEEKERQRFAQDIHDGLGALLAGIKMYVSFATKAKTKDQADEKLKEALDLLGLAVMSAKEIANNIVPDALNRFGLVASVENLIARLNKVSETHINFDSDNIDEPLKDEILTISYRIVSELIANALKHSNSKSVYLRVFTFQDRLFIIYMDNGNGFDYARIMSSGSSGSGLFNIKSRANSIGGSFNIFSLIGSGTDVVISIPIENS